MALYDLAALADYIAKQQGAGLVPEFTNIQGQEGFFINDEAPPEEKELDLGLPDITTYENQEDALLAHQEIKQEHENKIRARQKELETEAGIAELRNNIRSWKATGLGASPLVAKAEETIAGMTSEIQQSMSLGVEGDESRKVQQHLDTLEVTAKTLPTRTQLESRGIRAEELAYRKEKDQVSQLYRAEQDAYKREQTILSRADKLAATATKKSQFEEVQTLRARAQAAREDQTSIANARANAEFLYGQSEDLANRLLKATTAEERLALEVEKEKNRGERDEAKSAALQVQRGVVNRLKEESQELAKTRESRLGVDGTTKAALAKIKSLDKALIRKQLTPEDLPRIEAVLGIDKEIDAIDIGHLDKATPEVIYKERIENRKMSAPEIVASYPGHIAFFKQELANQFSPEEVSTMSSEIDILQKDLQTAASQDVAREFIDPATGRLMTAAQLAANGMSMADVKRAKPQAILQAKNDAVIKFEQGFKDRHFALSSVPLETVENLTPAGQAIVDNPTLKMRVQELIAMIDSAEDEGTIRAAHQEILRAIKNTNLGDSTFAPIWGQPKDLRAVLRAVAIEAGTTFNDSYVIPMGVSIARTDLHPLMGVQ